MIKDFLKKTKINKIQLRLKKLKARAVKGSLLSMIGFGCYECEDHNNINIIGKTLIILNIKI